MRQLGERRRSQPAINNFWFSIRSNFYSQWIYSQSSFCFCWRECFGIQPIFQDPGSGVGSARSSRSNLSGRWAGNGWIRVAMLEIPEGLEMPLPLMPFMCVYILTPFLQISLMRCSMMFHDICRFKIWFYRNFCFVFGDAWGVLDQGVTLRRLQRWAWLDSQCILTFFIQFFNGQFTNNRNS